MQNMMDGHHQLAMMQQQQHQNHGQQQQQQPLQAATSESDARGPRHDELLMESKSGPVRLSEFWRNLDGLEKCWRNL